MADNNSLNRDQLKTLIKKDDEFVIGALLTIYHQQTPYEKDAQGTLEQNNIGFNGADGTFMSSVAEYYLKEGHLSSKQIDYARKNIVKYSRQLLNNEKELLFYCNAAKEKTPKYKKKRKEEGVDIQGSQVPKEETFIKAEKEEGKNTVIIKFKFPKGDKRFFETIDLIKTLPNRRFVKKQLCWKCPISVEVYEKLIEWNFDISSDILKWHTEILKKPKFDTEINLKDFKKKLMPFQKEGVSFIQNRNGRVLLADEMGLGKTIQALGYMQLNKKLRPVIIVCPSSLKLNWKLETNDCIGDETIEVIAGKKIYPLSHSDVYIVNYDILASWADTLMALRPELVILDECHYIRNSKTIRTKAVVKLTKKTDRVIAISGTPIENRPIEFFNVIKLVEPGLLPSRWKYAHRFCGAKHNGFGWDFSGATNTSELYEILTNTIMVRRKKKDVLKDLPDKTRSLVPIRINNRKEYERAEDDILAWIQENEGKEKAERAQQAQVLVAFEKLKQLSLDGKIGHCFDWIDNFLASDKKLIIFATHKKTIKLLMERYKKLAVKLDGETKNTDRQDAIDRFQNDPTVKLFVGNIQAAGVGITLTAASNLCFIELPWTPGAVEQAEDRCHRIGQKNGVNIYYLIAENTIEVTIAKIIGEKQRVLGQILDGEDVDNTGVINELINEICNKDI